MVYVGLVCGGGVGLVEGEGGGLVDVGFGGGNVNNCLGVL